MSELDLLGPSLREVGAVLSAAASAGRPAEAILDAWASLNETDPRWQALLVDITHAAARLHPSVGAVARIHPDAVASALVDPHGRLRLAAPRFVEWIGDPDASPDCRRLAARAAAGETAIGLVTGADGRVLTMFAKLRSEHGPWTSVTETPGDAGGVLLVAFAPSKSSTLAARAAAALGLAPLEAKVAEALLDAPNLAVAADSIGVGRATAKDALERAMRKAGVTRATDFVGRIVDLTCDAQGPASVDHALVRRTMGLSAAEARVAAALASGGSAGDAAAALGISQATVKSYRRAVFAKTAVNRSRDLRRLISEVSELDRLASASEVRADTQGPQERLRLILSRGRRIAFIDYGPASGAPLVIGHGFTTGRLVPAPFLARCHRAGYRVIIPQRPGFGLTDAVGEDYLGTAADDLAAILDSAGAPAARMMMRDGGAASLLSFAQRYPTRLDRPVLFNPRPPRGFGAPPTAPMAAISRLLLSRPGLIEPFAEMLRQQTRSDLLEAMIRRTCSTTEPDRVVIEADPAVVAHIVRDMQGLMARTTRGFVAEQQIYSAGWSPPGLPPGAAWTIAYSTALIDDPDLRPWAGLPGLRTVRIEGAGLLAVYSHGPEVLALLD